jgi:3-methyladenine DNA glycosylase AlkD
MKKEPENGYPVNFKSRKDNDMELTIREQLEGLAEEKYRRFTSSLTPGKENILGVRIPLIRKMAAKIAKGDWRAYLKDAKDDSMEEVMLQGMVIGCCKAGTEELLNLAAGFIPKIDCWSVCDTFCSGLKITKNNKEQIWDFIQHYLRSEKEYDIRFGVVMLLHFLSPEYAPMAFEHFDRISHEGYYVKMAVAWVLSMYFVHLPEETMRYLKHNNLDNFTYNKALQKITESLRVDPDTKAFIRSMKRK